MRFDGYDFAIVGVVPILSNMMSELYTRDSHVVIHNGQYPEDRAQKNEPPQHVVKERLAHAQRSLDMIGKLRDEPRLGGEGDQDFARRLAKYFPGMRE